ncbi:TolC family protein, partial [Aeromonas hydrophila]
ADTNLTPSVNGSLGASSNKDLKSGKSTSSMGPSLGLSYEVDLWGKLASARDQASWEAAASEQDLASTRLMLIGNSLEQYWQLGYLASAITLSEQQLANLART